MTSILLTQHFMLLNPILKKAWIVLAKKKKRYFAGNQNKVNGMLMLRELSIISCSYLY